MEKLMIANIIKSIGSRRAFTAAVAFPFLLGGSLYAQAPAAAPGGEATTERIVVTGSNIPTAEEVTASPLDTLSTQDIAVAGGTSDVLTILQKRNPDFIGGG
ncbi:MAG: hypothetical protein ACREIF_18505, partial [Chthoniobacterales bacterium]